MADDDALPEGMQPETPKVIAVVATQRGALPVSGLVEEGASFAVAPEQYSASWMKPANAGAAKMVKAEMARRADAKKPDAE